MDDQEDKKNKAPLAIQAIDIRQPNTSETISKYLIQERVLKILLKKIVLTENGDYKFSADKKYRLTFKISNNKTFYADFENCVANSETLNINYFCEIRYQYLNMKENSLSITLTSKSRTRANKDTFSRTKILIDDVQQQSIKGFYPISDNKKYAKGNFEFISLKDYSTKDYESRKNRILNGTNASSDEFHTVSSKKEPQNEDQPSSISSETASESDSETSLKNRGKFTPQLVEKNILSKKVNDMIKTSKKLSSFNQEVLKDKNMQFYLSPDLPQTFLTMLNNIFPKGTKISEFSEESLNASFDAIKKAMSHSVNLYLSVENLNTANDDENDKLQANNPLLIIVIGSESHLRDVLATFSSKFSDFIQDWHETILFNFIPFQLSDKSPLYQLSELKDLNLLTEGFWFDFMANNVGTKSPLNYKKDFLQQLSHGGTANSLSIRQVFIPKTAAEPDRDISLLFSATIDCQTNIRETGGRDRDNYEMNLMYWKDKITTRKCTHVIVSGNNIDKSPNMDRSHLNITYKKSEKKSKVFSNKNATDEKIVSDKTKKIICTAIKTDIKAEIDGKTYKDCKSVQIFADPSKKIKQVNVKIL